MMISAAAHKNEEKDMKSLYDALIDGIPDDMPLDDMTCTHYGVLVRSGENIGIADFRDEYDTRPMIETGNKLDLSLKELATGIKSWNITEAAMGHAAINAYYNTPAMAKKNGLVLTGSLTAEDRNSDPFIAYQKEVHGKKVVVVGHFPYLEKLMAPICDLKIIDPTPDAGIYPEQAAEYLLPEADFAFIGSLTITDKRLPRYLELARDAFVGIVGPITTLSPVLFDYGVDELDGFVVKDNAVAERIVKEQENLKIYSAGQKVSLRKAEYEAFMKK